MRELDLIDFCQVRFVKNILLSISFIPHFINFLDTIAGKGILDHFPYLGVHLGGIGGISFGKLKNNGACSQKKMDIVPFHLFQILTSGTNVISRFKPLDQTDKSSFNVLCTLYMLDRHIKCTELL